MLAILVKNGSQYRLNRHSLAYKSIDAQQCLFEASDVSNCAGTLVTLIESRSPVEMGGEKVSKHLVQNERGFYTWVHSYELDPV